MRASSSGPVGTVLMLLPLVGVPLLAVFGVPPVGWLGASPSNALRDELEQRKFGVGESAWCRVDDLFAPIEPGDVEPIRLDRDSRLFRVSSDPFAKQPEAQLGDDGERSARSERGDVPAAGPDRPRRVADDLFEDFAGAGHAPREPRAESRGETSFGDDSVRSDAAARDELEPTSKHAAAEQRGERKTAFRDAVDRLNKLGIKRFRLEPGDRAGEFCFCCQLTPPGDSNVTRRFEAEAADPGEAARTVVAQVEEWLAGKD